MRKTSKFVALILGIVTSVSLIACSGKGNSGSGDSSDITKDTYTVNFDISAGTQASLQVAVPNNEPEKKKINALIAEFNKKYPLINVTVTTPFTPDNTVEQCVKQFKADLLADVVWCNSTNYYGLVANGIALNLDNFISQAKTAGAFDYENDFTETFRKMGKVEGSLYAIGRSTDSVVTFYNKKMLQTAGVDTSVIKNGWTWEDFLTCCEQLRTYYNSLGDNYTKVYPVDANLGWESVGYPIIKSFGGEVIDAQGNFCLTEEQSNLVYDFVQNLVTNGYIGQKNDSIASFESAADNKDTRTAFLFQSAAIGVYEEEHADLQGNIDVVSFPLINGDNSAIGFGFAGYAVNRKVADNQAKLDATMAFMSFLMSYDGQQAMAKDGGLNLPSIRKDLSADNASAEWCAKYQGKFNMAAYTYGDSYKAGVDFLANVKPTLTGSIVSNLNKYTGSYCISKTKKEAYNLLKAGINEAFDDV